MTSFHANKCCHLGTAHTVSAGAYATVSTSSWSVVDSYLLVNMWEYLRCTIENTWHYFIMTVSISTYLWQYMTWKWAMCYVWSWINLHPQINHSIHKQIHNMNTWPQHKTLLQTNKNNVTYLHIIYIVLLCNTLTKIPKWDFHRQIKFILQQENNKKRVQFNTIKLFRSSN